MKAKTKCVSITAEQEAYIATNHISLSKFVQGKLDEEMAKKSI